MGGAGGKFELTKNSRLTLELVTSGITDFDKIALIMDDIIEKAEQIRYKVVNGREVLMRISKIHKFQKQSLVDSYRVWLWATGACNFGDLSKVQFKASWHDYDAQPAEKEEKKEEIVDTLIKGAKAGFGSFLDSAKKAATSVVNKVTEVITGEEVKAPPPQSKIVFAELGSCGDYKLTLWPKVLAIYIENVRLARDFFPQLHERMMYMVDKAKALKDKGMEILGSMDGLTTTDKMFIVGRLAFVIKQFDFAIKVAEQFLKSIPTYVQEVQEFLNQYKELLASEAETAQRVYQNVGIKPYYNDESFQVLRQKMSWVSEKYISSWTYDTVLVKEVQDQKTDRKSRRPRAKGDQKFNDVHAEEGIIPCRFRWLDSRFFDTNYSAASIALSELEYARKNGGLARKTLMRLTSANRFTQKDISSAFEVFTWAASVSLNGKLSEVNLQLLEVEPFLGGKDIEKVKFSHDKAEEFRTQFLIWLKYYSPQRFARLGDYWQEVQTRSQKIFDERFNILEHTKTLTPADVYNAASALDKNLLATTIYIDRSGPIFQEVISRNGYEGQDLYYNRFPIIMEQADSLGVTCKGTPMAQMAEKHVQGRLAAEEDIKLRKQESKVIKEKRNKRKWLWSI